MVTCNFDSIKKMERGRRNTSGSRSNASSGFHLLDGCDTVSSVSRNSIYKLKIDAMFDDTKYVSSHQNKCIRHIMKKLTLYYLINSDRFQVNELMV